MIWMQVKTLLIYLWLRIKRCFYIITGQADRGKISLVKPVILRTMNETDIKRITVDFKENEGNEFVQLTVHYNLVDISGNVFESNKRMITKLGNDIVLSDVLKLRDTHVLDEVSTKEGFS